MKQKAAVRYLLQSYRRPILIFYGIVLLVYALLCAFGKLQISINGQNLSMSGVNVTSMIFLFVCGLNAFKEDFYFFLQNGVSRKTQFTALCLSTPVVALIMAAADSAIDLLIGLFLPYNSLFGMLYGDAAAGFTGVLMQTAWILCLYLSILAAGYLIALFYYRMNTMLKVLVSVGVPVFFTLVLPLLDAASGNRVAALLLKMGTAVFGLQNGPKPLIGMLFLLACAVVCGILARLLQRRAVLK